MATFWWLRSLVLALLLLYLAVRWVPQHADIIEAAFTISWPAP